MNKYKRGLTPFAVAVWLILLVGSLPEGRAVPLEPPRPDGALNPAKPIKIIIASPEMDQILEAPDARIRLTVTNFNAEPGGPHLHFVLDNRPFQEHFDPERPVIFRNLSPGTHVFAVFAVTSWHESWKNEEALAVVRFHVQKASVSGYVDLEAPLLIFNMPQGTVQKVKGEWVLLDFLVKNVQMSEGTSQITNYRVNYFLDGREANIEYLETRFLKYVNPGEHRLGVQLTDKSGRFFPNGSWNRAVRSFRVAEQEKAGKGV